MRPNAPLATFAGGTQRLKMTIVVTVPAVCTQ